MHRGGGDADGQRHLEVQAGDPGPGGGGLTQPACGALGRRQRQARQQDGELPPSIRATTACGGACSRSRPAVTSSSSSLAAWPRVSVTFGSRPAPRAPGRPAAWRPDQQQGVDLRGQALPVGQPGQPVVVGVVPDLAQQLLLADRGVHVGEHRVQRTAVTRGEGQHVAAAVADLQVARLPRRVATGAPRTSRAPRRSSATLGVVGAGRGDQHRAVRRPGQRPAAEQVVGVTRTVVPARSPSAASTTSCGPSSR